MPFVVRLYYGNLGARVSWLVRFISSKVLEYNSIVATRNGARVPELDKSFTNKMILQGEITTVY